MSNGPALKCVIAWSDRRNLCSLVVDALESKIGPEDVRRIGDESLAVYGAAQPAEIRDWAAEVLEDGESVLVLEFERWSGHGPGVDAAWLLKRGH